MNSCKSQTKHLKSILTQYGVSNPSDFAPATSILRYMLMLSDIGDSIPLLRDLRYRCFEQILLDYGRFYPPHEINRRELKSTLSNRFSFTASNQSDTQIYCEGYVLKNDGMPMETAWLFDSKNGIVIDYFFSDPKIYFGIPFKPGFVKRWNMTGRGIFSPESGYALLKTEFPVDQAIWRDKEFL
jgi:hypothetical protein